MSKQIIIINGTGGSGKDTFVEMVAKQKKVYNFSSIDKVKEIAKLIGWAGAKTEKDRKFLSDLKKLTTDYNDMPFKSVQAAVAEFLSPENDKEIMFIHIREPEEIERAKKAFQARTLLIKRDGLKNISTNTSDANVDNYDYDDIITNTTLEEFNQKATEYSNNLYEETDKNLKIKKKSYFE